MSKKLDNEFMHGMLEAIFTTIFQPKDLPTNFFDLLDIKRRKVTVTFDRSNLVVSHDVINFTATNLVPAERVIDHLAVCRNKISEMIERALPEYEFTMMYIEGECRESERGPYLMELALHTMICKMILMSQMNIRLQFSPDHLWIEIIKKDPKAVFETHSSLILYPMTAKG